MEQDLKRKKEELEQLKAIKERLEASGLGQGFSIASPVAPCSSVLGQSLTKGASSAKPRVPKKKGKHKPRRQPGLPSEERQEH